MGTFLAELLVSALLIFGAAFVLVGSIGLARLPDITCRTHAPTKAATLGIGSILIASMASFALFDGGLSIDELMITIFMFLTAPVSAFMIVKAHIFRTRGATEQPIPETGTGQGWATLHGRDGSPGDVTASPLDR